MDYRQEYEHWLSSPYISEEERKELEAIKNDEKEIEDRFFAPLAFGTAGLRAIMGMGTRRINRYAVRQATYALGETILAMGGDAAERGAVVCYDCRINSRDYALDAAAVLAARGIHVRLFDALRPTPELSFAIRLYKAAAGINITASHNPKEYNGYKVYGPDGAQLAPELAGRIAEIMAKTDAVGDIPLADMDKAVAEGTVELIGEETDAVFLENVLSHSLRPGAAARSDIKTVYTPFYGAGARIVPRALKSLGLKNLICVEEQMEPDGNFPTAKNPNPEFEVGFERALALAEREKAELIIGTDPDSDRIGVMVRAADGKFRLLTGNQMGVLFLDYVISAMKEAGTLPKNAVALKSIVSTEMARAAAERHGVETEDTFTGFKYIAERMKKYENGEKTVIFGFEEAIGYAFGDFVRDKDAVTASVMAAEMAAVLAEKGMSLIDAMNELYKKLGYYEEKTVSIMMPGVDGIGKMKAVMEKLRSDPPKELGGIKVTRVRDYLSGIASSGGKEEKLDMRGENVLYLELEDGGRFIVRPSGTEPKIKVYLMSRADTAAECSKRIEALKAEADALAK